VPISLHHVREVNAKSYPTQTRGAGKVFMYRKLPEYEAPTNTARDECVIEYLYTNIYKFYDYNYMTMSTDTALMCMRGWEK